MKIRSLVLVAIWFALGQTAFQNIALGGEGQPPGPAFHDIGISNNLSVEGTMCGSGIHSAEEEQSRNLGVPIDLSLTVPEELIDAGTVIEIIAQVTARADLDSVSLFLQTEGPMLLLDDAEISLGAIWKDETFEVPIMVRYEAEGRSALMVQLLASAPNSALVNEDGLYEKNEALYTIFHSGRALAGMGGYLRLGQRAIEEDYLAELITEGEAKAQARALRAAVVEIDQEPRKSRMRTVAQGKAISAGLQPMAEEGEPPAQADSAFESSGFTKNGGTVTVQGTIQWRDENGGIHPSYGMTVQVRDEELVGSVLVTQAATGENGEYYFVVDNDDGIGAGNRDIFVRIRTANSAVSIEDEGIFGAAYEAESNVTDEVPDGTTITWNFTCANTGTGPACALHTGATYVAAYAAILNGNSFLSHIVLEWPGDPGSANYDGSDINLRPGDRWDWDVLFHEYGHYVMDVFNFANNPGGPHDLGDCISDEHDSKDEGVRMAWAEGWCTYFGTTGQDILNLSALGVPRVGDIDYADTGESNFSYSLETNSNDVGVAGDALGLGEDNELAVQRTLWDLYDTNSDSRDAVNTSHQTLFNIFNADDSETLSEAWAAIRGTLSNADDLAYGAVSTDHAIGPEPTIPVAGTLVTPSNPDFSWTNGVGCNGTYDGDDFDLVFYNANTFVKMMTLAGLTTNSASLSEPQIGTLASSSHDVIWAVEGRYTGSPATGPYLGEGLAITVDRPPVADANGPYNTVEGTDATLDGTGSSDPDGDVLTYDWDLDNDGFYDDATGPTPVFSTVGQDGIFTIGLRVTDPFGLSDTDSATVTVVNVAPSVAPASNSPQNENWTITVTATVTDPGWLDILSATIDWGDGSPVEGMDLTGSENLRPDALYTFTASHIYGDNGTFTAQVCGYDDDTSTCANIDLAILNVDPTAEIDETDIVDGCAEDAFIAHAGEDVTFSGRSTDPGSDDLDLTWNWGDATPDVTTSYLVNPPATDPLPSPSIQPRDVTDTQIHAFAGACLYTVTFSALDDDGGTASDDTDVVIAGNADFVRSAGYWYNQFRRPRFFTEDELLCFIAMVNHMSSVFSEVTDADSIEDVKELMHPSHSNGDIRVQFDRQLIAVWLNFANGALDYDEEVDTDFDTAPDTPLLEVLCAAEEARIDDITTPNDAAIEDWKDILVGINESGI